MSLVHEALRKAEREKQRKAGTVPPPSAQPHHPPPSEPAQPPNPLPLGQTAASTQEGHAPAGPPSNPPLPAADQPSDTNHFLLPVLIACVAIVAIIAIVFLVLNATTAIRQSKESTLAAVAESAPAPVAQSTVPTTPLAAPPDTASAQGAPPATVPTIDDSKYKISGIMKDPDGKPVAVINGRVAYEGYYIDGAIVEKIDADRVTIDVKGQKELLRLH